MLGPSENNDSVVLLSERPLIRMRMSPWWAADDYFHSDIDAYLENSFMDSLSRPLKQMLVATQIRVSINTPIGEVIVGNGRRVFLPSMHELGFGIPYLEGLDYINALKMFHNTRDDRLARSVLTPDVEQAGWYWTRSSAGVDEFYCVKASGDSCAVMKDSYDIWIRPCFSVSVDAEVTPVVESNHSYYELVGAETRRIIQEDLFVRLMTL